MEGNNKIIKEDFPSIVPLDSRFIFVIGTCFDPIKQIDLIINLRLLDCQKKEICFTYPLRV